MMALYQKSFQERGESVTMPMTEGYAPVARSRDELSNKRMQPTALDANP